MDRFDAAARAVHEALSGYLDENEIAVGWCLTIDIAGPGETRYLAHRAGGGHDGTDKPMAWTALGMLRCSAQMAEDQMRASTGDYFDEDDEL